MSNFVPSEICVVNAVNDAIILYWHLLYSSLSGGNSFMELYTGEKKKLCVSEMTVEVGILPSFSWLLPVESFKGVPTIDMMQLIPSYWVCC